MAAKAVVMDAAPRVLLRTNAIRCQLYLYSDLLVPYRQHGMCIAILDQGASRTIRPRHNKEERGHDHSLTRHGIIHSMHSPVNKRRRSTCVASRGGSFQRNTSEK
mmetsp:Transcript_24981/g.69423  ORF Transcript_24981/g.69423 Transcript_24981/m.69423 type:complete len:105 (-) Transcript_24981:44-358(-)